MAHDVGQGERQGGSHIEELLQCVGPLALRIAVARPLTNRAEDGFYAEEEIQPTDGPKQKQKVVKKIPTSVIRDAKALAIFTTMRTGLWMSGAGGSGILIARKEDGSWSPPSGILLHTAGLGFMVGIDIYDCVVVINTEQALEAFYKVRCTLGSEISVAAGPVGAGAVLDTELHKRQAPIFTYMKSRGFYAGVQIDGTIILERGDENERFYHERLPVKEILAGKVRHPPFEVRRLLETIKAAQGDTDFDPSALPSEPPPGDYEVDDGQVFGVPDKEDPDPYGVLALEKEGMGVVEAGTKERASWQQFSFKPAPTSPIHDLYSRSGADRQGSRRSSWRASMSTANGPGSASVRPNSLRQSVDQPAKASLMTDSSTQTDVALEPSSPTLGSLRSGHSRHSSRASVGNSISQQMQGVPEHGVLETSPHRRTPERETHPSGYTTPPITPPTRPASNGEEHAAPEHDEEAEVGQPVVHDVQTIQPSAQVVSRARLVTVQKRAPPKLPPRNPTRGSRTSDEMAPPPAQDDETLTIASLPEPEKENEAPKESKELESAQRNFHDVKLEDNDGNNDGNNDAEKRPARWSLQAQMQELRRSMEDDEESKMPGGF